MLINQGVVRYDRYRLRLNTPPQYDSHKIYLGTFASSHVFKILFDEMDTILRDMIYS